MIKLQANLQRKRIVRSSQWKINPMSRFHCSSSLSICNVLPTCTVWSIFQDSVAETTDVTALEIFLQAWCGRSSLHDFRNYATQKARSSQAQPSSIQVHYCMYLEQHSLYYLNRSGKIRGMVRIFKSQYLRCIPQMVCQLLQLWDKFILWVLSNAETIETAPEGQLSICNVLRQTRWQRIAQKTQAILR